MDLFCRDLIPVTFIQNWKFLPHNNRQSLEQRKEKCFQYSLISKRHYQSCKKSNKSRKASYRSRTDDHRITNAML